MTPAPPEAWQHRLILLAAILASYANSLWGVFQFDDFNVIVHYPKVHSWSAWWADVGHGLRPLLKLSYTLNWTSGWGEAGFHAFNIAVHLGSTALVYHLATHMLAWGRPPQATVASSTPLLAALLFALHPLQTEAITYLSGRSASLMTLLYLAALLAYVRAGTPGSTGWRRLVSPTLFVLAVATKETAITLPAALLLWDLCAGQPMGWRALWRRQGWHWGIGLLLGVGLLIHPRYLQLLAFSAQLHGVRENLLTQLHAMSYLMSQWALPWRANIDPDLPVLRQRCEAAWDLALWGTLALLAVGWLRRLPALSFALGWFVLQLLPIYVFFPRVDVANDRQLYLAAWPWLVPLATAWLTVLPDGRLRRAVTATALLALAVLTVHRNQAYRDEVALWEATVRSSPAKPRPYNNLGYAHFLRHEFPQARAAYLQALKLDPDYWLAQRNLEQLDEPGDR